MKAEAHWSVLKQYILLHYDRPRVNLLVETIAFRSMLEIYNESKPIRIGAKKPSWWRQFSQIRNAYSSKKSTGVPYLSYQELFTCNCPQWYRSQFLLCKHLIQNVPCPQYREVTMRSSILFIAIGKHSSLVRIKIDDEDGLWTSPIEGSNLLISLEDEDDFDYSVEGHSSLLPIGNAITEPLQDVLHHVTNLEQNDSGFVF